MKTLATLGLAGMIAAGSLAGSATESSAKNGVKTGAVIAGTIIGLGIVAAASQPQYYGYDDYVAYQPYPYGPPPVRYVVPEPRGYYGRDWCSQNYGYNSWTGVVTEPSGVSWQCSPPRR